MCVREREHALQVTRLCCNAPRGYTHARPDRARHAPRAPRACACACACCPAAGAATSGPGGCGRCFEIRCVTGPVQNSYSKGLGQDLIPNKGGKNFMGDRLPSWKARSLGAALRCVAPQHTRDTRTTHAPHQSRKNFMGDRLPS
jgi:hypothetical protein